MHVAAVVAIVVSLIFLSDAFWTQNGNTPAFPHKTESSLARLLARSLSLHVGLIAPAAACEL